jgi:hypothetical protein
VVYGVLTLISALPGAAVLVLRRVHRPIAPPVERVPEPVMVMAEPMVRRKVQPQAA